MEKKQEFGIENFLKCANVLIEGGNVVGKVMEDGKVDASDISSLFFLLDELTALGSVDWKELRNEVSEFNGEEIAQIEEHFIKKFDIPQENIEIMVEQIVSILIRLSEISIDVIGLVKSIKK